MTVPILRVSTESPSTIDADVLVVGAYRSEGGVSLATDDPRLLELSPGLSLIGITGAVDEVRRIPLVGFAARSLAIVGLGSAPSTANDLRLAAGTASRQLTGVDSIALALPATTDEEALAVLEGAAIGAYAYTAYRVDSAASTKLPASTITVLGGNEALADRARAIAAATHTVRDLVNMPPSDLYPQTLADAAVSLAKDTAVEVTVLDEEQLAAGGYGGILGVGGGSSRGPRLVKLSYSPAGANKHIALVGKGITFDTGGLSLKSPVSMVGMKYDMTGAATVLGVVIAAAALGLPVQITGWMCIAENMPSGTATRPNDVLRIRGGKTVENLNSDAEGRLVLADGLVAASEEHPDAIIDVATLTGAAKVALGNRYVAAMGDETLTARVVSAATRSGEQMWPMPFPGELRALLNSDVADIANVKPGHTAGGMLIAGVFLREFIGTVSDAPDSPSIPWTHLDIAGPANNDGSGWGYTGKGPTAVAVRTLITLAEEFSQE